MRKLNQVQCGAAMAILLAVVFVSGCGVLEGLGEGKSIEEILLNALGTSVDFELESITADIDIEPGKGLLPIPKIDLVFNVDIGVTNNSAIPLLAKSLDVRLFTSQSEFGEAELEDEDALTTTSVDKNLRIPKGETVTVPLSIQVPVEKVGMELVNRIQGGTLYYRVDALFDFSYKGVTVPFEVVLDEGSG